MNKPFSFLIIFFLGCSCHITANLQLGSLFKDHMVLQQGNMIPVWGWSDASEKITVEFLDESVSVFSDTSGKWQLYLSPQNAGGPYQMSISGKETIILNDIYIGEVWLCSGQSNMDMTVAHEDRYWCGVYNEAEEVAGSNYPLIRFFDVEFAPKDKPQETVKGIWEISSPKTIGHLSATAYFFGRELFNQYKVPIGLITSAYGASTAEAWTSKDYLQSDENTNYLLEEYTQKCAAYDTNEKVKSKYIDALKSWNTEVNKAKVEGKDIPKKPKDPDPQNDQHSPCVLYNGMIAPLIPYAIKGVIWYQGESNYQTAHIYDKLMEMLIYNWRAEWQQGDFPFIFVQLANHQKLITDPVKDDPMVLVREKQLKNLSVRNTAMVVAIDNANPDDPDNIHPKNKQEIGKRLAIAAMGKVYMENITYMGPVFSYMIIQNNKAILYFHHVGEGFLVKGDKIKGFAIAGADKKFVWAQAEIVDQTIIVSHKDIIKPLFIRYGWSKNPEVNLYNKAGLPVSPFRTDDL